MTTRICAILLLSLWASTSSVAAPVVVDGGDAGTVTSPRESVVDVKVEGALTWTYEGQAAVRVGRQLEAADLTFSPTNVAPKQLSESMLGMVRFDRGGELWKVTSVDEAALDQDLVADRAQQIADWVPDPDRLTGEDQTWTPHSWVHTDCDADADIDVHNWNGESRVRKTAPYGPRQTAVVSIDPAFCSGTMIKDNWVLTAAHCILDDSGAFRALPGDTGVTSVHGDLEHGEEFYVALNYVAGSSDYADDWALIKLSDTHFTPLEEIVLFDGAESSYQSAGVEVHSLGYPGWVDNTCDDGQLKLYHSDDVVVTGSNASLKLKADSGHGQSGGPFVFCPAGLPPKVCDPTEPGRIIGIVSGFYQFSFPNNPRVVGPKASVMRPEVLTAIN